jgi:uncharacterized protein
VNAAALLALQDIDTALDAITHKRPRLPEVVAHQEALAAKAAVQARAAAAQALIDAAQAAIEAAEHAASDLTTRRSRLEAQLKTVIAPREAEALMHQIATINEHRSELDDAELTALDQQADGEAALSQVATELPAVDDALSLAASALAAAIAALDGEAAELNAHRDATVAGMPADQSAMYERVRQQFHGVGVTRLVGTHCSGCHMDLSPAELDLVKAVAPGEAAECPQCGRIMIR